MIPGRPQGPEPRTRLILQRVYQAQFLEDFEILDITRNQSLDLVVQKSRREVGIQQPIAP